MNTFNVYPGDRIEVVIDVIHKSVIEFSHRREIYVNDVMRFDNGEYFVVTGFNENNDKSIHLISVDLISVTEIR